MKKVGIVTYHCVDNYGAVLQAYSLSNTLLNITKYDIEIVDYKPIEVTKNYSFKIWNKGRMTPLRFLSNLVSYPLKKLKNKKFRNFSDQYFKLSAVSESINWNEYDYLITGSDQVWNPSITKLAPYYLNFNNLKAKKVSYAASIGKDSLSDGDISFLGNALRNIECVSVREASAKKIVDKILPNKEVKQVLDPVFLKDRISWLKVLPKKVRYKNYILIYIMEYNKDIFDLALKLSKQENKDIIVVSPNANVKTVIKSLKLPGKVLYTEGPLGFLELIVNADFICTNSFHGTAFSIIFGKKFITVPHGTRNTRLESILADLKISTQQVSKEMIVGQSDENLKVLFEYDYESVMLRLEELKVDSIKYLEMSMDLNV